MSPPKPPRVKALRAALLSWYDAHKRDLPWRDLAHDPYAVWVSEVMLQQTRVDTVLPYYDRFLKRFPTLQHLADASEDEVLSAWSGLGYYRRARLLHRGVQEVVARYGGEVPSEPDARLSLPGVGKYTAGALGSVCFDKQEPIVDGNVIRILTRIFGVEGSIRERATDKALWELAAQLVVGPRPGDFNQAMMELGALVCSPKNPSCDACPVAKTCIAKNTSRIDALPNIPARTPPKPKSLVAVVATSRGRIAMLRGRGELFGGLYGVPMAPLGTDGDTEAAARFALEEAGVGARLKVPARGELVHVLSHRRLSVTVFAASHATILHSSEARWLETGGPSSSRRVSSEVGLARLTEKILALA